VPRSRSPLLIFLLLSALTVANLMPADARTRRRRTRAPRTPPRPSGVLRVVVDPADPAMSPAAGYRTVRLLDTYGGKWESRVDSTGVVSFAGVPPGRAVVSWWTTAGDSIFAPSDTVWIVVGRTVEDTLRLEVVPPSSP
jgi:hypothetical protein